MKKYIGNSITSFILHPLSFVLFVLVGCEQQSQRFDIPRPDDALHIRASVERVQLMQRLSGDVAVTFQWDIPAPVEGSTGYEYYFKMDIAGNDFATSISKMSVDGATSISFTHAELNAMMESWGVQAGQWTQVEAELIAEPVGTAQYYKPMLSTTVFEACGFASLLYVAGSATPAGNDYEAAQLMEKQAGKNVYTYRHLLNPGTLLFLLEPSASSEAYGMGGGERDLAAATLGEVKPFEITRQGFYTPEVDLDAMRLTLNQPLALIGSATPGGWSLAEASPMDQLSETRLVWSGALTCGELKFACNPQDGSFESPFYTATGENVSTDGTTDMMFKPQNDLDGTDYKWNCGADGIYTVSVDLDQRKVTFEYTCPYAYIWLCGNATPGGWDTPFSEQFTYQGNGEFVWTGTLQPGEIKFPLTASDYQGRTLMATAPNTPVIDGEEMPFLDTPDGNPDQKWMVGESGNYKITINGMRQTVKFEKK